MKKELQKLLGDRILILGMGREGQSTKRFLKRFCPSAQVATSDQNDGPNYLSNLTDFDTVIKTPGISWKTPEISQAFSKGIAFSSQTEIFLSLFRKNTIGITGTKGKSTTSSLIYHILNKAGRKVKLVGNIGKPVLDSVSQEDDKTLFVYEMSSHQLSRLTISPHIAVFLNIYPEHLDYYLNFGEYVSAKASITKYQERGDFFVYCRDFNYIEKVAKGSKAKKISFSRKDDLEKLGVGIIKSSLAGEHNEDNIKASVLVAKALSVDDTQINQGIKSFKPLDDRLETVAKIHGVTFINDSLATIPQATIEAVRTFGKQKVITILGGYDRGVDQDVLGSELSKMENVSSIILIGQTAQLIKKSLTKFNYKGKVVDLGRPNMYKVVEEGFKLARDGDIVLLSPAATSFDMFKDYKDRANQYKESISRLRRRLKSQELHY